MDKNYFELAIKVNPICTDIICEIINSNFECEGIVTAEEEYKELELVKSSDVIKAYIVADSVDEAEIKNFFAKKRKELIDLEIFEEDIGSFEVSVKKQEIVDWSKKWKENWKPSKISDRIVICPTWEEYQPSKDEIVINLDPGNAFGTGTHATTQLCVDAIEKYMPQNAKIADIGTGSGILAICAIKLGAKAAVAIDNDETAVLTAIENAELNKVADKIHFETATIDSIKDEYDFVLANILHNVLAEIMPDLKRIMKIGAKVVLSGILNGKEPCVIEAIEKNSLKIVEINHKKEWISIVVEKI